MIPCNCCIVDAMTTTIFQHPQKPISLLRPLLRVDAVHRECPLTSALVASQACFDQEVQDPVTSSIDVRYYTMRYSWHSNALDDSSVPLPGFPTLARMRLPVCRDPKMRIPLARKTVELCMHDVDLMATQGFSLQINVYGSNRYYN